MTYELKKIEAIENPAKRGDAYLEAKEYERAAESFMEALTLDTGDVSLSVRLGEAYMGSGNYSEARQIFQEVVRINPNSLIVKNFLEKMSGEEERRRGEKELHRKEYQSAIENFKISIQLNPDNVRTKLGLISGYLEIGEINKPIEVIGSIVGVETDDLDDYIVLANRLAIRLRKEGQFDDAIKVFRKALKQDPDDPTLYFNLAMSHLKKDEKDFAKNYLKQAIQIDPEFQEAKDLLKKISK